MKCPFSRSAFNIAPVLLRSRLSIWGEKIPLDLYFTPCAKIKSMCIINLNEEGKIKKVLEDNRKQDLHPLKISSWF